MSLTLHRINVVNMYSIQPQNRRPNPVWFGLILLIGFMGLPSIVSAQDDAISRFFDGYVEQEGFTSIRISQRMFSLIADLDKSEKDVQETVNRLTGLYMLAADSATLEKKGLELYQEAVATMKNKTYEELMSIRDGGERIEFYILESGNKDRVEELLMLVGGEHTFFLLSITGEISLRQIAKLADSMEIEGLEHLEKLDD